MPLEESTENTTVDLTDVSDGAAVPQGDEASQDPAPEGGEASQDPAPEGGEAQAYQPDYNYNVLDRTKQMPDWVQPLVKDKTLEDNFRDLFSGRDALDHMKGERDNLKQELAQASEFRKKYDDLNQGLDTVGALVRQGNYDAAFRHLGLDERHVIDWAAKRVGYRDLSPAEQAEMDRQSRMGEDAIVNQQRSASMQDELVALQNQQKVMQLDMEIGRPEVSQIARDYDDRRGKVGAFRELVISQGISHYNLTRQDLLPAQAVDQALTVLGFQRGAQAVDPGQVQNGVAQTKPAGAGSIPISEPRVPEVKPVIPQTRGSGLSATNQALTSTDAIRAFREKKYGA